MARPLPPSERSNELPLVLTARIDGVDVILDPPLLRVDLEGPAFGLSTTRVDPLWHDNVERRAFTLEFTPSSEKPLFITLRNLTSDLRFHAAWADWTYSAREIGESEGGAGASAQDRLNADGSLTFLVRKPHETPQEKAEAEAEARRTGREAPPKGRRHVRLEFMASVEPGVEPCRILQHLEVSSSDGEKASLSAHLLLEHPDSKLLAMLPGVYQESMADLRMELSTPDLPFFERYLVGLQDAIDPLREALHKLDALFGPYSTPPDHLVWLASWVCMPMDANWPEMKRRRLISEAVELFRWRGTRRGLSRFLEIYTGVRPIIHDQPQQGAALGQETLMGAPDTIIGDVPEHTFTVTLGVPNPAAVDEEVVHRIIQSEKPAHTAYRLLIVRRDAKGKK